MAFFSSAAASSSVSNPVLAPGDSYLFSGAYTSVEWTGDVMRMTLDPITGMPSGVYDWQAQSKLDNKVWDTRKIYVFDSGVAKKLKEFTAANFSANSNFKRPHIDNLAQILCSTPDVCLSNADKADAAGAKLVNYLRGDRTWEGLLTDNTKYFRKREHVLGDIVNAQTVYVDAPYFNYVDPGYGAFKASKVYVARLAQTVRLGRQALKVLKGSPALLDHKVCVDLLVQLDHKVRRDHKELV